MKKRLRNLGTEVRSLKNAALVAVRDTVRKHCKGMKFFDMVQPLSMPVHIRKLITFNVRR